MTDTFLRNREVVELTGIPRSTRYELMARGEFPQPIKLGRRIVMWSAAEIGKWQREHLARRDGTPEPA